MELNNLDWMTRIIKDVDEMNERFVGNVKTAGERKIGYIRLNGRKKECKSWWNEDIGKARKERKRLNRICRNAEK